MCSALAEQFGDHKTCQQRREHYSSLLLRHLLCQRDRATSQSRIFCLRTHRRVARRKVVIESVKKTNLSSKSKKLLNITSLTDPTQSPEPANWVEPIVTWFNKNYRAHDHAAEHRKFAALQHFVRNGVDVDADLLTYAFRSIKAPFRLDAVGVGVAILFRIFKVVPDVIVSTRDYGFR